MKHDDDPRWNVEVSPNNFHDVGAHSLEITSGGVLVFLDCEGNYLLAYAPSTWISVSREEQ